MDRLWAQDPARAEQWEVTVPRQTRSEIGSLLQEIRALEMLANETEVEPAKLQEYWDVAADLITLTSDVEELEASDPTASYDDPRLLAFRRRMREVASRLGELALE